MKNLKNLTALRLIIHITDHTADEFRPSTATTPLDGEVRKYIENHLTDTLKASATHAARFQNPKADIPAKLCRNMIKGEHDFIEGSAALARRLVEFTRGNASKGNLAVVLFKGDEELPEELGTTSHTFLALMKLNLGDAFVAEFDKETGSAVLRREEGAVPTNKEGLQKSAFISQNRWGGEEIGYDMMLLDRQNRGTADFFRESFLSAVPALDDEQRWLEFNREARKAIKNLVERGVLTEEENRQAHEQLHNALNHSHLDACQWARDLPVNEAASEALEQALSRKLTDREFSPPPALREKDKTEFVGDNDLRIKIPTIFKEALKVGTKTVDGQEVHVITIETHKWDPK